MRRNKTILGIVIVVIFTTIGVAYWFFAHNAKDDGAKYDLVEIENRITDYSDALKTEEYASEMISMLNLIGVKEDRKLLMQNFSWANSREENDEMVLLTLSLEKEEVAENIEAINAYKSSMLDVLNTDDAWRELLETSIVGNGENYLYWIISKDAKNLEDLVNL